MKIIDTKFKGLKIIKQISFKDKRGFLRITHNEKLIKKKILYLNIAPHQEKILFVVFIFNINIHKLNISVLLKEKY